MWIFRLPGDEGRTNYVTIPQLPIHLIQCSTCLPVLGVFRPAMFRPPSCALVLTNNGIPSVFPRSHWRSLARYGN